MVTSPAAVDEKPVTSKSFAVKVRSVPSLKIALTIMPVASNSSPTIYSTLVGGVTDKRSTVTSSSVQAIKPKEAAKSIKRAIIFFIFFLLLPLWHFSIFYVFFKNMSNLVFGTKISIDESFIFKKGFTTTLANDLTKF